jgi:hypothetical protein
MFWAATGSLASLQTTWMSNAQAKEHCSDKTLKGKWGLSFEGSLIGSIAGTSFTPGAVTVGALLDSNGAGSFTGTGSANVNGVTGSQSGVGAYVVNPDCTGTGTFHYPGWDMDLFFVISGEGNDTEVWFVNTSQPAVIHGRIRKL